jgi:hypothetical protein
MIMDFLGRHVRQCEQASAYGDPAVWCCVNNEIRRECDEPGYPDFDRWGFANIPQPNALSWGQVMDEIDGGRPFAFSYRKNNFNTPANAIGHMLVAIGYSQTGGPETRMLLCLNPRAFAVTDEETVAFSDYAGSPPINLGSTTIPGSAYTHLSVYYDIHWAQTATANQ